MANILEHTKAITQGDARPPPIARLIGFDLISVKPGEGVIEFQATEAHANPMGTLPCTPIQVTEPSINMQSCSWST